MSEPNDEQDDELPACADAGGDDGFGCLDCRRYEVREHVIDCKEHGEHFELACCWCGSVFFSYMRLRHGAPEGTLQ